MTVLADICYLCGRPLDNDIDNDHVPPRQFYSKEIRGANNPNLLILRTHRACNSSYQSDEEYFIHTFAPLVMDTFAGNSISRELFETLIQDLLESTLVELDRAIASAYLSNGIVKEEIEQVLLVGGSTRIVAIRKMVATHMGLDISDVRSDLNPDEVVSRGAAIVARRFLFTDKLVDDGITEAYSDQSDIILNDVTSHTLGILGEDGNMFPIIPKDSQIPARKSEGPFTNSNNAKKFQVKIFQGEDQIAFNNTFLGELSIDLPETRESGYYKFEIIFSLDSNGILDVSIISLNDNKKWKTVIRSGARVTNEQLNESRRKIDEAFPSQR